tara:strand:+ start:73 stop:690 length:618 start_codon:yes stop_codon:yes gene_type:complete
MSIVKLNNRGVRSVTAFGSLTAGSMRFIKKLTASSSATLSFVNGSSDVVLDNTYKEYLFTFKDIHPATDSVKFQVNFRDGGSNYDASKTTTHWRSLHYEDGSTAAEITYLTATDLANGTGSQSIAQNIGNDNDQGASGYLHLFNPSSTTFVKHFISRVNCSGNADYSQEIFAAGYCNTTTAIDGVQFSMTSGNIDAGDICLYGIN